LPEQQKFDRIVYGVQVLYARTRTSQWWEVKQVFGEPDKDSGVDYFRYRFDGCKVYFHLTATVIAGWKCVFGAC
jgi:hypothetical protein